jgi:hypothetical protein
MRSAILADGSATAGPLAAPSEAASPGGAALWRRALAAPFPTSLAACVALALLSGAVLPTVPSYDPWSWIVWGREVFDPHLSLIIGGGSSWKPFPVIFTALYGPFAAAPTMWVITERVGALMAFVAAYRLAAHCTARIGHAREGPLAGVTAAFCLILLQDFAYYFYRGASEPIVVACALWAVDRLLAGRRGPAFALGVALGLMRPEVWPLMLVLGGWLAWRDPRVKVRAGVLAGLAFMPFMWFAPPGVTTGKWFSAATQAHEYNGHLGSDVLLSVMRRGVDDQSVPVLALAVLALAITVLRERDRAILALGALGAAWWVVVVGETLDGYPGLERFFLPAAALACVLAGVGVVRIGAVAGEAAGRLGGRSAARAAAVLASLAAVAISYHFVAGRVTWSKHQYSLTQSAVRRLDNLSAAVAAVGGHDGVFPCKSPVQSFAAINHSLQTALAFKLHSTLERVGTVMANEGVMFVGPWDTIDGGPAAVNPYFNRIAFLKRVGPFKIYRVYRAGHDISCVGA